MNGIPGVPMSEDVLRVKAIIGIEKKKCSKCGKTKNNKKFCKDKGSKSGLSCWCRACVKQYREDTKIERSRRKQQYYQENKTKIAISAKIYRQKNKSKISKYLKQYKEDHLSEEYKSNRAWKLENPEEWAKELKRRKYESQRNWAKANPEKIKEINRNWRINNPEAAAAMGRRSARKQRSTPKGRIGSNMSRMIRRSLNGSKGRSSWEMLAGYTAAQLKKHLEKQFTSEMTWENYGTFWAIDHKIPQVVFNYEKPTDLDFRRCWALSNLQPLEMIANKQKRTKLERPFQPSLLM